MNIVQSTFERVFPRTLELPPLERGGRFGLDWAWGNISAQTLHGIGASFACRYLSTDSGKNLKPFEAKMLSAQGVDIVVVWETLANRSLGGYVAGVADARAALAQARACGMPAHRPIYFAVDFDTSGNFSQAIAEYFKGVNSVLGVDCTGAYGGYNTIAKLFSLGLVRFGWQTLAWSGGVWHPRAGIRQTSINHTVAGVGVDYNISNATDFGQWRVGNIVRPVGADFTPLVADGILGEKTFKALQYSLNHKPRVKTKLIINGKFDAPTRRRLEHYLRVKKGGTVAASALQRHVHAPVTGNWNQDTTRHLQIALNNHKF